MDKKAEKKEAREYRRHKRVWFFTRLFGRPAMRNMYGFKGKIAPRDLPEPYLVLANHSTDLDPVLIGMSFPKQMYFVASEHVYRQGFASKLLYWAYRPIAKMKGASDRLTVLQVLRTLRSGKNVCLFPDGNRSFNGRTGELTDAIGKLIKTSGANLITYKITGGYFTNPRWGFGLRKGKMSGQIVNVYTKEQLKEMEPSQVKDLISADISENAYERQNLEHIYYKGKKLAVGMECCVCVCPKCHHIDTIKTSDNSVFCENCGEYTEYTPYGYFKDGFQFHTIEEWDDWQIQIIKDLTSKALEKSEPSRLFVEENVCMNIIGSDHSESSLGTGSFAIYTDRFEFRSSETEKILPISLIPDMSVYEKTGLVFTDADGIHYELKANKIINVRKFIFAWEVIRQKIEENK